MLTCNMYVNVTASPWHFGAFLQAGRSPYNRGGGGRGGGPFRGGRGNFGHRNPRPDGSATYSRGRGRGGRGRGGRRFPSHGGSSSPYPETSVQELDSASAHAEVAQLAGEQGEEPQTVPVSSTVSTTAGQAPRSSRRPPQIAWCELCRVDCTSPEILEQHKNGKKHKKNLQRFEEMQNYRNPNAIPIPMPVVTHMPAPNPIPAPAPNPTPALAPAPLQTDVPSIQSEQKSLAKCESEATVQPENVHGGEIIKQPALENLPTGATVDESKMDSEQQNDMVEQSEVAEADETEATTRKRKMDRFDTGRRGLKRKLRGGRGGKHMRMVEQQRPSRHVEPPKEVVPIVCDLCNVKCDTQAVFDCHLAGKKHLSKLKRFQGHQALYGSVGLQALYPPNPNTQSIFVPQVHPHQQPIYVPPQQQMMAYGPPQGQQIAAPAAASEPKASLDSEMQQEPQITPGGGQLAGSVEPEGQEQGASSATLKQDNQQTVGATSQNGVSESEVKEVTDPSLQ
ncbi:zinc finger protein [Macleaya cordata]|uniref:Zinc finger protein n=1 Tax=Macleaya cordata TaxID=56857 RepID=A0A200RCI4_MACCD|nr:zinc finger protein [Macleaya cordata]